MKVSDYIAKYLAQRSVAHVFEMVGGMIVYLLDAAHKQGSIDLVSLHHEQAASFAACGVSQYTGKVGVAMATSGPGALNMLTGIATAYFDSIPTLFITGQVNTHELRGDKNIRQLGFQETDIVSIVLPVVKGARCVDKAEDIPAAMDWAFDLATRGRPGPVLLDIPMNVQRSEIESVGNALVPNQQNGIEKYDFESKKIKEIYELLLKSERPLVLAGAGVRLSKAEGLFRLFLERCKLPAVFSLMGIDLLEWGHAHRIGLIGTYGNRWANYAMRDADLLLVLGSRLDIRQTGADIHAFIHNKKIIRIDIDSGELYNRFTPDVAYNGSITSFIESFFKAYSNLPNLASSNWLKHLSDLQISLSDQDEIKPFSGVHPVNFIKELSRRSESAAAFVLDIGQNQMWAAQSLRIFRMQRIITSGSMGAMGYALPSALGIAASTLEPVVCISGDGGIQCNIQELEVISRKRYPVKIIVFNNQSLGMVRQFQEEYFDSRFVSTVIGYGAPRFTDIAKAYKLKSFLLENDQEIPLALEKLWEDPKEPFVLEVKINLYAKAYPKTSFGGAVWKMDPINDGKH